MQVSRGQAAPGPVAWLWYFTRAPAAPNCLPVMRKPPSSVRCGWPVLATALACIVAFPWTAQARADVALFEVAVPLAGTTEADRAAGMAEALRAVAVKASGRREAAGNATIRGADPAKYVQRYSTTADRKLKVGFDGGAIERLLAQAGLPLWPAERPLTLVSAPVGDPAAVEAAAQGRGLPIAWSRGDETTAGAVLSGVPSGGGFDWTFTHDGRSSTAHGSAEDGVHLAADALAARYATAATRTTSELVLRVGGMDELSDYAGLLSYLGSLSLVRSVGVDALDGEVVTLRVSLRGDGDLLARIAALDGRLRPASAVADADPTLDFVYQP